MIPISIRQLISSINGKFIGKVTSADVEKIAKEKMQDLNAIDLNGAINMVKGSAVSMGMEVVN